jgi:hypothetical protein
VPAITGHFVTSELKSAAGNKSFGLEKKTPLIINGYP